MLVPLPTFSMYKHIERAECFFTEFSSHCTDWHCAGRFYSNISRFVVVTSLLLLAIWLGLMPSVLRCQAYMDIRDEVLGMAVVASGGCSCKLRLGGAPPIDAISSYTNIGRPRNLGQ